MPRAMFAPAAIALAFACAASVLTPHPAVADQRNCAEGVFRPGGARQVLHWRNICNQPIVIKWWTGQRTSCQQGCVSGKINPGQWITTGTTTQVARSQICAFTFWSQGSCKFAN